MKTVWKYPIVPVGLLAISLPVGAQILDVQAQDGTPMMWAVVDDEAPKETRTFALVGTGHPMPKGEVSYVGTFQFCPGERWLVFHLFELQLN